jgi:hypothetical protein
MIRRGSLICVLLLASAARGQPVPPGGVGHALDGTVIYGEGPGFRLGAAPLTLHPGVELLSGGDSNVFYTRVPVAAGFLQVGAHLDLATLPPQAFENDNSSADPKVDFRLSAQVEYRQYLSDESAVRAWSSVLVHANAGLIVLPKGKYTVALSDRYERTIDPNNSEVTGNVIRNSNKTNALVTLRPGDGAIELGIGDQVQLTVWQGDSLTFGNNVGTDGKLFARWRLPRNAFLSATLRVGYVDYWIQKGAVNSVPLRGTVGSEIQLIRWMSLAGSIGYGNSFNAHAPSFSGVIGAANVTFLLPFEGKLLLSYERDFLDTMFANFLVDHHPFAALVFPVGQRFTLRLSGGVRLRRYEGLIAPATLGLSGYGSMVRDDLLYESSAELWVRLSDWLWLGANYNLFGDSSHFVVLTDGQSRPVSFVKHIAMATLHISY